MGDLVPATPTPQDAVKALKGPPRKDWSRGDQWFQYPSYMDMDKSEPQPPIPPLQALPGWIRYPEIDPNHDKVGEGLFGMPAQHLQQMAGEVLPFPKSLLEQDQNRSKGPDWGMWNTKPFDPLGDMTGGGKVVPIPLPLMQQG